MDSRDVGSDPVHPLVLLFFLQQQGTKNLELSCQLHALGQKLAGRDINSNGFVDAEDDGELQTDGNFSCNTGEFIRGLEPHVEEVNPEDAAVLRNVAAELIEIADRMERNMVARSAQSLIRKLTSSPLQDWRRHLATEVQVMLKRSQGTGLEQMPQERVMLALTMMLNRAAVHQPHSAEVTLTVLHLYRVL
ncbi:hypothetical protein AGOR_G00186270 [Albula goreensis]|uniref:BH3-interacting domain death agonist n=1 Tax=Albula goreensis TaxID=1534307 RepID=A0A8T3D147_9TELE|nr:hypothetical protein AGOR_G00186270 [Albula goreensis]